jgi:hypothetical protein
MSLITGNKVKKTHKPRYCEKEKDKANKRILKSLSFDKTLSVFERKIPLTFSLEFRFHQE